MGSVWFSGCSRSPGCSGRYLSGLCAAVLGLCAAGWLALAPAAFGYRRAGVGLHPAAAHLAASDPAAAALRRAALADWATAAGLALVSLVTLVCWVVAWRRTLRADGIAARAPRQQAETSRRRTRRAARAQRRRVRDGETGTRNPDPVQVLIELRALLTPLLAQPAVHGPAANGRAPDIHLPEEPPEPGMYPPGPAWHDLPAVPAPRSGGLAATETTLAGAELLITGCGEEEAW